MIARLVTITVGIWLMAAPAVLDYGQPASDTDRIVGPTVASLALVAVWELSRPLRWATLPLGVWLLAAPLALDYDDGAAVANSIAAGLVIAVAAPLGGAVSRSYAGGWRSLVRPPH